MAPRHFALLPVAISLFLGACSDDGPTATMQRIPIEIPTTSSVTSPVTSTSTSTPGAVEAPPTTVPASRGVAIADLTFELQLIGSLEQPIDMATRPGDAALYIAEKTGRVYRLIDGTPDPEPFLDLTPNVSSRGERGLLGITFTPDGSRLVASYTDTSGTSTVASWPASPAIDPDGRQTHLTVEQPFANHNGGDIAFGPDGHLYVGFGDGGSGGDPLDSGQDTTTVLGAVLRIDLTTDGYSPAPGNPLSLPERPELWLWGLRNPWRFSFDRSTGELWIGDVGQDDLEEIDLVPRTPVARNLGWNRFEGTSRFSDGDVAGHLPPLVEYDHGDGVSVAGGYVYRGTAQPQLDGVYFYADFGGGWIRALRQNGGVLTEHAAVFTDVGAVASFGEDHDGEVYVLTLGGPVYRITAR